MLETLPADVLANIVSRLDPLEEALENIPRVCRAWRDALVPPGFWWGLADAEGVELPAPRKRSSRSAADPKRTFRRRREERSWARAATADRLVWKIWMKLHRSDCAAAVRQALVNLSENGAGADHRLSFYENRTLLILASWRGRTRTVAVLLNDGASVFCRDDRGATPLLIASWAGNAAVVRLLLLEAARAEESIRQQWLDQEGEPPKSSSCGGRGPKSALRWAERKGFGDVVQILERAGAVSSGS